MNQAKKNETVGSQKLLQMAVEKYPSLLKAAIVESGALDDVEEIFWTSPLKGEGYKEYRDALWLRKIGIEHPLSRQLNSFWPQRGPVWDATAITDTKKSISVEAKAHIPEAASPASSASPKSMRLIEASLAEARKFYAPRSSAEWSGIFYQYANRLAHHYFLRYQNHVPSILLFINFLNAKEVEGPTSKFEWEGAIRLIHTVLVPCNIYKFG